MGCGEAGLKNNQNLFFTVLEASKCKIQVPANSGGGFPVHRWLSSHCPHVAEGGTELSGVSYKATTPIREGSALMI